MTSSADMTDLNDEFQDVLRRNRMAAFIATMHPTTLLNALDCNQPGFMEARKLEPTCRLILDHRWLFEAHPGAIALAELYAKPVEVSLD